MKKLLSIILIVSMVIFAFPLTAISSFAVTSGDFEYEVISEEDKTCAIIDYTGTAADLEIPQEIDGYSVTKIGDYAFEDCTSLLSVTVPAGITVIGEGTFWDCTSLANINVSADNTEYTSVDGVLFSKDMTDLLQYHIGNARTEYAIPNGVTSIADYSFPECALIESITFPDSVTSIGETAFAACSSLKSVELGSGVKTIGDYAFAWCGALTDVKIPYGVTTIGESAFDSCTSFENITFPDSVTSIGQNVIWGTAYYKDEANWENDVLYVDNHLITSKSTINGDCVIKDGTKTIANSAFSNCESLENITIPNSVEYIGQFGFYKCSSLKNVTIPDSVLSIDYRAFGSCASLENVVIGAGVTYIEEGAFRSCKSLKNIEVSEDNSSFTSVDGVLFNKDKTELLKYPTGSSNTTYTVPNSVTTIGYRAFDYSASLESIVIGAGVTHIGENAFKNCTALKDVYYTGTQEQWNEIVIETDGTFENVNIHYNYRNDNDDDSAIDEEPGGTETPDTSDDNPVIIPDTGDTSSISIATVALIAGAALVLTRKKRDDAE